MENLRDLLILNLKNQSQHNKQLNLMEPILTEEMLKLIFPRDLIKREPKEEVGNKEEVAVEASEEAIEVASVEVTEVDSVEDSEAETEVVSVEVTEVDSVEASEEATEVVSVAVTEVAVEVSEAAIEVASEVEVDSEATAIDIPHKILIWNYDNIIKSLN